METLEIIREECLSCSGCSLSQTRNNVVFGVGNPHAEILLIGEGPGEQEDLKGEPFVGRAGKLLDEMLRIIDLDRNKNIYIANIVKCRPPQNRDPLPEEQNQCIGYLRRQVKAIDPKLIVCLGRVAAMRLMDPSFKITKEHGQWIQKGKFQMMALYHPAYLLRDNRKLPETYEDLKNLERKIMEVCPQVYDGIQRKSILEE